MPSLKQWFTKKDKPEPASIHPKNKTASQKPTRTEIKTEPRPIEPRPKSPGLNREEAEDLEKLEFESSGIPYELVLAARAKKFTDINPRKIIEDTDLINSKLFDLGLNIKINYLECFEAQLFYLNYQRERNAKAVEGINWPNHNLIHIIAWREAEKMIRQKFQLAENPAVGELAKRFQIEVQNLFKILWDKSLDHQLRQRAQIRLRQERKLPNNELLLDVDVIAMMQKIKAEQTAKEKK
ncbi:MAG: hypothetical protein Q7K65_05845 [Candidatus Buchananbacteria bacterium]|nr:hypothetical protein [Candidatus Buchananbacteria bacterium]